eukprot:scaffold637_cov118-Isochrysis_galbana.AAC.2
MYSMNPSSSQDADVCLDVRAANHSRFAQLAGCAERPAGMDEHKHGRRHAARLRDVQDGLRHQQVRIDAYPCTSDRQNDRHGLLKEQEPAWNPSESISTAEHSRRLLSNSAAVPLRGAAVRRQRNEASQQHLKAPHPAMQASDSAMEHRLNPPRKNAPEGDGSCRCHGEGGSRGDTGTRRAAWPRPLAKSPTPGGYHPVPHRAHRGGPCLYKGAKASQ